MISTSQNMPNSSKISILSKRKNLTINKSMKTSSQRYSNSRNKSKNLNKGSITFRINSRKKRKTGGKKWWQRRLRSTNSIVGRLNFKKISMNKGIPLRKCKKREKIYTNNMKPWKKIMIGWSNIHWKMKN